MHLDARQRTIPQRQATSPACLESATTTPSIAWRCPGITHQLPRREDPCRVRVKSATQETAHSRGVVTVTLVGRILLVCGVLLSSPRAGDASFVAWSTTVTARDAAWALHLDTLQSKVPLPDRFIVPGSEVVAVDGRKLVPGEQYRMDYRKGQLTLLQPPPGKVIFVRYKTIPVGPELSYRVREQPPAGQVVAADSGGVADDVRIGSSGSDGDLLLQGTKTVSLSVGSNRDLSLDQSLRLSLRGSLPQGIEVEAVLSDENLPIQPEGTTQELEELDQVRINIRRGGLQATLGDYVLESSTSQFAGFSRKLQGIRLTGETPGAAASLAMASSRGEFASVEFTGQDRKQGPYRLVDYLGSSDLTVGGIVILAGTEDVWVDGQPMTRGADRDYVVDYGQGELTFTENRLITAESRIVVDFEYSNRKYRRTSYYAQAQVGGVDRPYEVEVGLMREADDRDAPLEESLGNTEKKALGLAGDDGSEARVPAWSFVPVGEGSYDTLTVHFFEYQAPDSGDYDLVMDWVGTGAGEYRREGVAFEYWGPGGGEYTVGRVLAADRGGSYAARSELVFQYRAGASGVAEVTFARVPEGEGEYRLVSQGQFAYVGPRHGDRTPYRYLPLPSSKNVTDVRFRGHVWHGLTLSAEGAWSHSDVNLRSSRDDGDNGGGAVTVAAEQSLPQTRLGGLRWRGALRHQQAAFSPLGRSKGADYYRGWNVETQRAGEEDELSLEVGYRPVAGVDVTASVGDLTRPGSVRSRRTIAGVRAGTGENRISYELTRARVSAPSAARLRVHHAGGLRFRQGRLGPYGNVEAEEITGRQVSGSAFVTGKVGLAVNLGRQASSDTWWESRRQRAAPQGVGWLEEFLARAVGQIVRLKGSRWGTVQLQYTRREKAYADAYLDYLRSTGGQLPAPSTSHLARGDLSFMDPGGAASLSVNYRARDEEIRRLVEELVPEGEEGGGEYDSTGAWVGSELGTYRKELVPVGDPESVSEVAAGVRARLQPDRVSSVRAIVPPISLESEVRAQLSTRSDDRVGVYLILPRVFRSNTETLRSGLRWRNALRFPTRPRSFSTVLQVERTLDRDNRYQNRLDRSRSTNISLALRLSPRPRIAARLEAEVDRLTETREGRSFRVRERSAKAELQRPARPGLGGSLAFGWELAEADEMTPARPGSAWGSGWTVAPTVSAGAVRGWAGELGWQVWYRDYHGPWESIRSALRRNEQDGVTHTARARLDYRISEHTSVSGTYQGTRNPGSRFIHQGSMEVRAFF